MAENKTQKTKASVDAFIKSIENEQRRNDAKQVLEIMKSITRQEPKMWGPSIVGFGDLHYKYESGREGDWFQVGFSPRKQNLTLYLMPGHSRYADLMAKLGKHKTAKSCIYINKLEDLDLAVLKQLIKQASQDAKKMWK